MNVTRDLRFALRAFRRHPGVPVLAVSILAVGLGGFLALWSAADGVLWRPLPYDEPERLVRVWGSGNNERRNNANPLDAADWKARSRSFESLGAFNPSSATVTGGLGDMGAPEYVPVARVTSELFQVLRVEPALGRFFTAREHTIGEHRVAVLSWERWQSHFAGASNVLGRRIQLDGFPYVIVGVAPKGFTHPVPDHMARQAALFRPLAVNPTDGRGGHFVQVFGRLKPGVSVAAAQAEIDAINAQLHVEHPGGGADWEAFVEPLHQAIAGPSRQALVLLVAATALLLLLACGNVAALLLARSTSRGAELAVRGALGASRGALVRQLLLEVLVLGLAAGVGGVFLGRLMLRGLALLAAGQVPLLERASIDGRALLVGLAATLLTVLIAGAAPSLHGVRAALVPADGRRTTASRERRRLERVLVTAQLALCLTLLVGAALLARSLERLYRVDPGFQTAHALTFGLYLPADRYPDEAAYRAFFSRVEERLARLPEVEAVGGVSNLPLGGGYSCSAAVSEGGADVVDFALQPCAEERVATPGYFDAIGLRRIAGRTFTAADDERATPVVVVSESFARQHWPGRSALGRRMKWGLDQSSSDPWRTVVGVVRDVRHFGFDMPSKPEVYMPEAQQTYDGLDVVVRSTTPAEALLPALRRAVAEVDPQLPLVRPRAMDELLSSSTAARRLRAWTLGGFAALALLLATAGLYGSLAHAVGVRRRELSVRMAVGAGKRQIVNLVLGEGAALTAAGLLAGGAGSIVAARALRQLLFGVEPLDAASFAAATALLGTVALVAAWLPARRAASVDPVRALREE